MKNQQNRDKEGSPAAFTCKQGSAHNSKKKDQSDCPWEINRLGCLSEMHKLSPPLNSDATTPGACYTKSKLH